MNQSPQPRLAPLVLIGGAALIAGGAFIYMVKLMHDMTLHIGRMAADVSTMSTNMGHMQADMASLAEDVGEMRKQVESLPAIATDMEKMRVAMGRLTGLFDSGEPMRQLNPMGIMQQMMPGGERR